MLSAYIKLIAVIAVLIVVALHMLAAYIINQIY